MLRERGAVVVAAAAVAAAAFAVAAFAVAAFAVAAFDVASVAASRRHEVAFATPVDVPAHRVVAAAAGRPYHGQGERQRPRRQRALCDALSLFRSLGRFRNLPRLAGRRVRLLSRR